MGQELNGATGGPASGRLIMTATRTSGSDLSIVETAVPETAGPLVSARASGEAASVSLVIPTKNEASNVAWVLEQIPACVDEIVIVDGHSSDATLVTALSCRTDIRIVTQQGVGKGDALRTGFEISSGDIIVMIDADGSMSPREIPHFLHFLLNGYDFVKGSRFIGGGGSRDITAMRRLGNKGLLHLVNVLYRTQLTDLCYGFCAFHRRYLPFLNLMTTGFEVETALTISAVRSGLRIAEVPSFEMPRRYGNSNLRTFRDGTRVLQTIIQGRRYSPQPGQCQGPAIMSGGSSLGALSVRPLDENAP
jgi:glycosyltransferase involved in cell wall biosynthesis